MTMSALLSHFGLEQARYVTTSGRVVFDGVATNSKGEALHPEFGLVTQVAPHRFHGAVESPVEPLTVGAPWWAQPGALDRDITAMSRAFPCFRLESSASSNPPRWVGELDTGRGIFRVAITYRRDQGLPHVTLISGQKLRTTFGRQTLKSPHLYLNDNLCVAGQDDWHPATDTAATVVGWTAHWLAAFTEWRFARKWPIEGAGVLAV